MTLPFKPQKCLTAEDVDAAISAGNAVMQPKFDGWRGIAVVGHAGIEPADRVRLYARSGTDLTRHLPHVVERLAEGCPPNTWLDGEIAALDDDWGSAQSVLGGNPKDPAYAKSVGFFVFDVVRLLDSDLMSEKLHSRQRYLDRLLDDIGDEFILPTPRHEPSETRYAQLLDEGYEGAVIKRLDSTYAPGKRGRGWLRLKAKHTADAVVIGFTEGNGEFEGLIGSIQFAQFRDGVLVPRGACSGMTMAVRRYVTEHQDELLGQVIEVRYFGVGNDGGFRHPQYRRFRPPEDKPAEECEWTVR